MSKKLLSGLLACALLFLAACGSAAQTAEEAVKDNEQTTTETTAETESSADAGVTEDGQNPVMNFVGLYRCDRASVLVEADGMENAKFTVTWGGSFKESSVWVMSGKLDTDTLTVAYSDCVRSDVVYLDNGNVESESVIYENGTGRIIFSGEKFALSWEDDQEHVADGMIFMGGLPEEELQQAELTLEDPAFYSGVTAMDKEAVEEIAAHIKEAYLNEDWESLAEMIRYPITIYGTELKDADAFLSYMSDKTVHESDRKVMEEEACRDMFNNGQGICMGSGQVWLLDPNYMTDEDPQIQIIAISGIVNK